jgi:hypothetical protein
MTVRIYYEGPAGSLAPFGGEVCSVAGVDSYTLSESRKGLPFDEIIHVFLDIDWELTRAQVHELIVRTQALSRRIKLRFGDSDSSSD